MGKDRANEKLSYWLDRVAKRGPDLERKHYDAGDWPCQVLEAFKAFGLDPNDQRDWKMLLYYLADAFWGESVDRLRSFHGKLDQHMAVWEEVNSGAREHLSDTALATWLRKNNPVFRDSGISDLRRKIGVERQRKRSREAEPRPGVDAFGRAGLAWWE